MFKSRKNETETADALEALKRSVATLREDVESIRERSGMISGGPGLGEMHVRLDHHEKVLGILFDHLGLELRRNPGKPARTVPGVDPFFEIVKRKA